MVRLKRMNSFAVNRRRGRGRTLTKAPLVTKVFPGVKQKKKKEAKKLNDTTSCCAWMHVEYNRNKR